MRPLISEDGVYYRFSERQLQDKFGFKNGTWLFQAAQGLDDTPVQDRYVVGCSLLEGCREEGSVGKKDFAFLLLSFPSLTPSFFLGIFSLTVLSLPLAFSAQQSAKIHRMFQELSRLGHTPVF